LVSCTEKNLATLTQALICVFCCSFQRGRSVLDRVGHQQSKWQRQVQQQRRNIYDRRTMLN
jgi:hypothetical protein